MTSERWQKRGAKKAIKVQTLKKHNQAWGIKDAPAAQSHLFSTGIEPLLRRIRVASPLESHRFSGEIAPSPRRRDDVFTAARHPPYGGGAMPLRRRGTLPTAARRCLHGGGAPSPRRRGDASTAAGRGRATAGAKRWLWSNHAITAKARLKISKILIINYLQSLPPLQYFRPTTDFFKTRPLSEGFLKNKSLHFHA